VIVDDRLGEDLGDRHLRGLRRFQQFGRAMHVVRAHHHVDVAGLLRHEVLVLLREASGHDDLTAVFLGLPRLEVSEVAVQLVVGVLTNTASVEHDHVGIGFGFGTDQAVGFEETRDALGVVLVHLAPHRAHDVAALRFSGLIGHGRQAIEVLSGRRADR
jgi:hypothetical protein